MLVGYMRVSSDSDRQTTDLQKDALIKAGRDMAFYPYKKRYPITTLVEEG